MDKILCSKRRKHGDKSKVMILNAQSIKTKNVCLNRMLKRPEDSRKPVGLGLSAASLAPLLFLCNMPK